MTCGCVVLAAGGSTRMGANKLVAELNGKPLIAHVVDAIRDAGLPPPVVVLGHEPHAIRTALQPRDLRYATAPDFQHGVARSLAAGIAAVPPRWAAAIVCLGDMPLVPVDLLRAMASGATESSIIVPMFEGRRGNPVLWGRDYFPRLTSLAGDVGARSLFSEYASRITPLDWANEDIRIDIDDPAALRRARGHFGNSAFLKPDQHSS